jgi:hypothetical protein
MYDAETCVHSEALNIGSRIVRICCEILHKVSFVNENVDRIY